MELLKDYWLEARKSYMDGLLAKSRDTVLLNIKSAIDLAPNKEALYIKLARTYVGTWEPVPPYIDGADDLILPTCFCNIDMLADTLKNLECFEGMSVSVLSDQKHIRVQLES